MAERTEAMLAKVGAAFESGEAHGLSRQADEVLVLREAVLDDLAPVGRSEPSDRDADEYVRLVAATGDVGTLSTAIGRELAPLARSVKDEGISPSSEAAQLLDRLLRTIHDAARSALRALVDGDERAAPSVLTTRGAIVDLSAEPHRWQTTRLSPDDPERMTKHRLQLGIVDRLRRIHGLAEHMALSVLPRSVLVGELASSAARREGSLSTPPHPQAQARRPADAGQPRAGPVGAPPFATGNRAAQACRT